MRRFFVFLAIMFVSNAIPFSFPQLAQALSNVNDVKNIGFEEKLSSAVALDSEFVTDDGKPVVFSDFLGNGKPVVLSLAYFTCPRLCDLSTEGVLEAVNSLDSFRPGEDYTIVTLSFDPDESRDAVAKKAALYRNNLAGGAEEGRGWHFLFGTAENILKVTDSVGFRFAKDGEEFAHPSGMIVLTPEGTISRYLYGITHEPRDFKLSLIEASEGKIGDSKLLNKVLMFCYQFDPVGKRYALAALNVVKAGGMVTLAVLVTFLAVMWRREKKTL